MELCYENIWGSICSTSWSTTDAAVACKALDFYGNNITCNSGMKLNSFLGPSTAYVNAYFGQSISPILFTGVSCFGNETSLAECPRTLVPITATGCAHSQDAGIGCTAFGKF